MILEGILILFVLGMLWFIILNIKTNFSRRRLLKKYNEDEDKSKQGERRKHDTKRSSGIREREFGTTSPVESERRDLLPPTETELDGKTSSSGGKSNDLAKLFDKLRKR